MVTRTAEMTKDSSVQMKRNELMQDFLSVQNKAMEEHDQHAVTETTKSEEAALHADKEADGHGYEASERQKKEDETEKGSEPEHLVPAETHIIDITV